MVDIEISMQHKLNHHYHIDETWCYEYCFNIPDNWKKKKWNSGQDFNVVSILNRVLNNVESTSEFDVDSMT